jgi:hypothetical protein
MLAKLIAKFTSKIQHCSSTTENNASCETPLYGSFKLPIAYLPSSEVHPIQPALASDLELTTCVNEEQIAIYDILFQPKHEFAKLTIKEWAKQYTSNIEFLKDSQVVLANVPRVAINNTEFQYQEVEQLWNSVKMDKYFMNFFKFFWEKFLFSNKE